MKMTPSMGNRGPNASDLEALARSAKVTMGSLGETTAQAYSTQQSNPGTDLSPPSEKAAPIWLVGFVIAVGVIGAVIAMLPTSDAEQPHATASTAPSAEIASPSTTEQETAPKATASPAPPSAPKTTPAVHAKDLPPSQRTLPNVNAKTQEKLNAAMAQADAMAILLTQLLTELEDARGDEVKLQKLMDRLQAENEKMTAEVNATLAGLGEGARFHFETYVKRTLGPLGSKLINQLMAELEMDQEIDENGKVRYRSRSKTAQMPPGLRPSPPATNPSVGTIPTAPTPTPQGVAPVNPVPAP
jgi:hypothetical protein